MVKKTKRKIVLEPEGYILPSKNEEMREFITKFRIDMMEHIVSNIKFAIDNGLSIVEVFQFKNSPFVVTISEKEFENNIDHIRKFYMEKQFYELCPRADKLHEIIKRKNDEKEKSKRPSNRPNDSDSK